MATYYIHFEATPTRYVHMHAKKQAGRQTWGGYQLAAIEVPVSLASSPRVEGRIPSTR